MRQDWHKLDLRPGMYICKECGREYYDPDMSIADQYRQEYICPDCKRQEEDDEQFRSTD